MSGYEIIVDPRSLSILNELKRLQILDTPGVSEAISESADLLVKEAQDTTWRVFAKPHGDLAKSIHKERRSRFEYAIGPSAPHGQRREKGFSGRRDRLGRYYHNDPAKPYLEPAKDAKEEEVRAKIEKAVQAALDRLGI